MIKYITTILKFADQGEKTGWTYIVVPADVAQQLKPGNKKSFRIKGKLDNFPVKGMALLPMGDGSFILALNGKVRNGIGKRHGAILNVQLQPDNSPVLPDGDLMKCLKDEPEALKYFNSLAKSHQNYFSKWIEGAKTNATKANRIAQTVNAMLLHQDFGQMLRANREKRF